MRDSNDIIKNFAKKVPRNMWICIYSLRVNDLCRQ